MTDFLEILNNNLPNITDEKQKASLQKAIALGVPSMKQEEWKYTYYNKILQQGFTTTNLEGFKNLQGLKIEKEFIDANSISTNRIVFVNGIFHNELSTLVNHPKINFWDSNNVTESNTKDFLIELNNALTTDGVFLEIGDNVVVDELIEIFYINQNCNQIINLKNNIKIGKHTQVKFAEYYINHDHSPAYNNIVTNIDVAENANVEFYKVQDAGNVSNITDNTFVKQAAKSICNVTTFSLTGGITRNVLQFDVNGERAESHMNGLYLLHSD